MNRLLLSTAVLRDQIAAPTLAEAKKPHPAPAKHKVVKAAKVKKTTTVETKAQRRACSNMDLPGGSPAPRGGRRPVKELPPSRPLRRLQGGRGECYAGGA